MSCLNVTLPIVCSRAANTPWSASVLRMSFIYKWNVFRRVILGFAAYLCSEQIRLTNLRKGVVQHFVRRVQQCKVAERERVPIGFVEIGTLHEGSEGRGCARECRHFHGAVHATAESL
jgi:hypothetical protein